MENEKQFGYIIDNYNVPAELGREVLFQDTRKGIIVKDLGNYIGVNFYDKKPTNIEILHPTYELKYLGIVAIRKITKSQQNYQDYLKADWYCGSFAEWLGIKQKN